MPPILAPFVSELLATAPFVRPGHKPGRTGANEHTQLDPAKGDPPNAPSSSHRHRAGPWPRSHHGASHDAPLPEVAQQRLGGKPAITAVVNDFVGNVAKDNRINKFFGDTDIPRLERLLVQQICAGAGGPCTYEARSMREAHRGLGVTGRDFNALVEYLVKTLDKFNVPEREKNELLAVLGPMQKDIVPPRSMSSN